MKTKIERRLAELRGELAQGQRMLGELETQEAHLRASLLRLGGAVQALEELLAGAGDEGDGRTGGEDAGRDVVAPPPAVVAARNGVRTPPVPEP